MTEKDSTLKDVIRNIDDLASSTAAGFALMERRFEKMDKKIEDEVNSVRIDLSKKIEDEVNSVRIELSKKIEDEVRSLGFKMQVEFRNIEKRIDALELKLDQSDKLSKADILAIGDEVYHIKLRTKKLEQKIAKLKLAN